MQQYSIMGNNSRTSEASVKGVFQNEMHHYAPDLEGFLTTCEKNYLLAKKIIDMLGGLKEKGEQFRFGLALNSEELGIIEVRLVESSRYTSTVVFHQVHPSTEWLPGTQFSVCLYHDACLAEVIEFQGCRNVEPAYQYPNSAMMQCDEKRQHNLFLYEWLLFCMANGCDLKAIPVGQQGGQQGRPKE